MKKRPVILSTDPGIDDAVAIALALFSEELEVKLICPIFGNVSLEHTKANTEKLLTLYQKTPRVVLGSSRPLLRETINASEIHGESGMDGYEFPEATIFADESQTAVEAMHEVVNEAEKTTLVGIGPLTDIALFIHLYPQDLAKIDRIVVMGGSLGRGNYGVLSEFNFAADPEAAKIVFNSGIPIQVAPLEVGNQAKIMPKITNRLKSMGEIGEMIYQLFSKYRSGSVDAGLNMYDALAIALIVKPEIFEMVSARVEIETTASLTYGASLIDLNNYLDLPANAEVAVNVEASLFEQWFIDSLAKTAK
ncbi:nucleoside hydrolase [Enterococcus hulanensis]|uniref:Nucleoside hydrolase n=1 Tax=Enterococcus hulanensis TaxID=2559929 RepID=A0ABU3F274_9ENTE|nr:nucleoside hydrolase [Enterococcus hulanensis]MDT2600618.1 nucleoside hydrolase [Enterococcus hulanensis]MDT2610141.1 nucleoside hydrolase [Enterococcus hulanensis]MDT2617451.1 nucleoside hydrolase [Enterococcus hulanensis]MDT2628086.1 nucleoside hydrolase [Enterococcus hulanensis]MDT2655191.1 nucleoside hydrolase [Enterococcus hulanensis]